MRHLACVLAALALSVGTLPSASANSTTPFDSCLGRWTGWGHSDGDPWSIDMLVTANNGKSCGTIEYPSLGCGGALTACTVTADGQASFVEIYDHNPGTCAPAGSIVARCEGGKMAWTWTGQRTVSSVLTRQ
jgi:hypothetical protein